MKLLQDDKIRDILKQTNIDEKIKLSKDEIDQIVDIYNRVINDDVNKNKGFLEQESMVTYMGDTVRAKENLTKLENHFSDNKHMSFFEGILPEEAYIRLRDTFTDLRIPTSSLKGFKANIDNYLTSTFIDNIGNTHQVVIKGFVSYSPDDDRGEEDYLRVFLDGELVYDMASEIDYWNNHIIDTEQEDNIFEDNSYEEVKKIKETKKDGTKTSSTWENTYVSKTGKLIDERIDKNGKTYYTDNKGRFVSRKELY